MHVDWEVVARILAPVVTLVAGIFINRWLGDRPRLVVYYGHIASFQLNPPLPEGANQVHTHAIVIANNGRKAARDVRVTHSIMPNNMKVWPDMDYELRDLPTGGREIIFPLMIPRQQLTVSYLYFPPLTVNQILTRVTTEEGFAKVLNVVQMEPPSRATRAVLLGSVMWAAVCLLYLLRFLLLRLVH